MERWEWLSRVTTQLLQGVAHVSWPSCLKTPLDPSPIMLNNLQLFTNQLRTTYGDPDEVAVAIRKLQDLKQTGPASAYFAEFQQYIAIAGWGSGPVVVHMAIQGLKSHLQDELARIAIRPQTIGELIQFIVPLDNRLFEREQSKRAQTKIAVPRSTTNYASGRKCRPGHHRRCGPTECRRR